MKTKLRKSKNRNKHNRNNPTIETPYRVTFHRVNDSMFTGMKYAEIYPDWEWVHGEPMKVLYGLTWNGLNKRVDKWLKQHQYDVPM